jgi:hypothetical protein
VKKPPRKYSHDELVEVLQRSIALDEAAKEREFTEEDLAAAAKELGLAPETLQQARTELARRNTSRSLAPRPFDTRIELEATRDRLRLCIPAPRFSAAALLPLTFVGIWFAFLTFWTAMAARASLVFAGFSLPFWVAGFGLARRALFPMFQVTTLELGPEEGTIETLPVGGKTRLVRKELRARAGKHRRWKADSTGASSRPEQAVILEHGTKAFPLLAGYSLPERRWVLSELKTWLAAREEETP